MISLLLTLSLAFASEKFSADVYDLEGKTKHFTFEATKTYTKDAMTYESVFKTPEGEIAAQEKAEVVQGQLVRYEASRPPVGDKGVIEVKDKKVRFSYTEKGKESSSKENIKENMLFSGTLVPHLEANFADSRGETGEITARASRPS